MSKYALPIRVKTVYHASACCESIVVKREDWTGFRVDHEDGGVPPTSRTAAGTWSKVVRTPKENRERDCKGNEFVELRAY
ncbi:Protein of unknown function [Gryllus bimaculatus]|nr:Protein of unknown function [Gryllus bimaculatus]